MKFEKDVILIGFCLAALLSLLFPVGTMEDQAIYWWTDGMSLVLLLISLAIGIFKLFSPRQDLFTGLMVAIAVVIGASAPIRLIAEASTGGFSAIGLWIYVVALALLAWRAMALLSLVANKNQIIALVVPALFGLWLIYLWQVITTGFAIPSVLLPSPSEIGTAISVNAATLYADFYQTVVKSVFTGFLFGCGAGFLVAILVDRVPFMQRGLLPLGSLVSAVPIVGIAPIMVMWFGFDWESKAAVIVIMTFFPMLINTLAGLEATGKIEYDLMRSYAAGYWQTLFFVRLPNALPFIFNALKINSTLAMIGAIVAEFFGTPIVGMGFRISTEVGRMNVDIVWATIAIAALVGSTFYGILALMERRLTFWHASYRQAK